MTGVLLDRRYTMMSIVQRGLGYGSSRRLFMYMYDTQSYVHDLPTAPATAWILRKRGRVSVSILVFFPSLPRDVLRTIRLDVLMKDQGGPNIGERMEFYGSFSGKLAMPCNTSQQNTNSAVQHSFSKNRL